MKGNLGRRQFLLTGAAMAALGVSGRLARAADTHLRVAWWGGKTRAELTQKVVDLYVSRTPGTTISTEDLGWGDYWPRLSTQIAGGNSPDLIQMDIQYLAEYARRGVLLPLDEFIPSIMDVSDFDQKLLGNGMVDAKQFGVPLGGNAVSLIINKTAFDEAGIEIPGHDTTWEKYAADMAAFAKGTTRKGYVGSPDGSGKETVLETWLRQRGKDLYDADSGHLNYDETDVSEWFEMWAAMRSAGGIASAETQALEHGDIDDALLTQGKSAIAFANSNQLVGFQAVNKDELVMASYPRVGADGKGGLFVKPTMFFSIFIAIAKQGRDGDLPQLLSARSRSDRDNGGRAGHPRDLRRCRRVLRRRSMRWGRPCCRNISGLGELAGELPPAIPAGGGEVASSLLRVSEQVAFGTQSPADGATEFITEAKAILARG